MSITNSLAERIDALLPQTQCRRCTYPGCRDYAEAVSRNEAGINQCPPGGEETIAALSKLTRRPIAALDPVYGEHQPHAVAVIDEPACIGCTKCIQACPVDAIVGAAKLMHTVITVECTGCELCIPPCPVDCIDMQPASHIDARSKADYWRQRYLSRLQRLERLKQEKQRARAARKNAPRTSEDDPRKRAVAEAVERARLKRAQRTPG